MSPSVVIGFDKPPEAEITPDEIVILDPSGLTKPETDVVAVGTEITPDETSIVTPSGLTTPRTDVVAMGTLEEIFPLPSF